MARAKINLALHVTGQRDDGYHLLDTLVTFADYGDVVVVDPSDDLTLSVTGPYAKTLCSDAENLVLRAATALRDRFAGPTSTRQGAHIALEKNLPIASGIGGGSADAAATLLALNELWQLGAAASELAEVGLAIGADVPMCLAAVPCRATGIGEQLHPADLPSFAVVLVNPGVEVSTPQIFSRLESRSNPAMPSLPEGVSWLSWLEKQRNDLQRPAIEQQPIIANCLTHLTENGSALARMSGSGATCFGLFATDQDAALAARSIQSSQPNWWVVATRTTGPFENESTIS